jgi:hypothetical protein
MATDGPEEGMLFGYRQGSPLPAVFPSGNETIGVSLKDNAPPEGSPEAVFNEKVTGNFPLSKSISSARYWAPIEGDGKLTKRADGTCQPEAVNAPHVPRPNVDLNWLSWISLIGGPLGLDHFYANSPATGIAKLLTLGGFGIWWIWDVLQLWLEPKRVLNYGMMPPFDTRFHEPVAQGMITDKPHPYQITKFSLWATCEALFGFLGLNLWFMKKGVLAFFYTGFLVALGFVIYYGSQFNTMTTYHKLLYGLGAVFPVVVGFGHLWRWLGNASRILMDPPELLLKDGIRHGLFIDPEVDKLINPYSQSAREDMHKKHPGAIFESYAPAQIRRMFAIRTLSEKDVPECGNQDGILDVFVAMIKGVVFTLLALILSPLSFIKDAIWTAFTAVLDAIRGTKSSASTTTAIPIPSMNGGGSADPLSTESLVLGGTLIALVLGGIIKGSVEHFVPS